MANIYCKEHPDADVEEDSSGDAMCTICGEVIGMGINEEPEWRAGNGENSASNDDPSRVGGPNNNLHEEFNPNTTIAYNVGADGSSYKKRNKFSKHDHLINTGKSIIDRFAHNLKCSGVVKSAALQIFAQALKALDFKLGSVGNFAGASLYLSCQSNSVSRSMKEIASIATLNVLDVGELNKARSLIQEHVFIRTYDVHFNGLDIIHRYCRAMGLSTNVKRLAAHIAKMANDVGSITSRSPLSIAAAAIYMASQTTTDRRSRTEISKQLGVAPVTLKKLYTLLYLNRRLVIPRDYIAEVELPKLPRQ